ncbi:MAG: DUF4336 domain-containing protein [Thalassobaculaceae bacterium]|nr:DUF4336 domain-containing protein [Thalassobaculaceae bacterium]
MSPLEPFADDIWTLIGGGVSFYGVPFPTRSVIIRLSDGRLWVHSPVAETPATRAEIAALGPVGYLIAPTKIHSRGIAPWQDEWPDAETWVSPGFRERHPNIPFTGTLSDAPPEGWAADIDQRVFAGHALLDEVVFLHRASGTLIVTDLIQKHMAAGEAWVWLLIKRLAGVWGPRGGTAPDIRFGFRDRDMARAARDHILAWDFDRLILSHGLCLKHGAKEEVRRVWAFLD